MTTTLLPTQQVVITGGGARGEDVTVLVNGAEYGGWLEVRITRGVERLPADFELRLTDISADPSVLSIKPGDACVVKIGNDPVITGYVDIVMPAYGPREHSITLFGRSKCADLVDCSAEWPGGQITGSSVLEVAQKLAAPYGIEVYALDDVGGAIPQFNLNRGETPYEIIERLCRYRQLLCYDDVDGNLVLARVSSQRTASGFREGVNVQRASAALSINGRFSEYRCYPQSVDTLLDLGAGGDLIVAVQDKGVSRHRVRIIIAELSGGGVGPDFAKDRATWEASRRYGRSAAVRITTDAWRDVAGLLYEPNTLVLVECPTIKVASKVWVVAEVTYRKTEADGTSCDLLIMPPEAFQPEPTLLVPLPAEFAALPTNPAQTGAGGP